MKHPRKGTAMVVFGLLLPVLLMGAALSVDLAVSRRRPLTTLGSC